MAVKMERGRERVLHACQPFCFLAEFYNFLGSYYSVPIVNKYRPLFISVLWCRKAKVSRLECIKMHFVLGLHADLLLELATLPRSPSQLERGYLLPLSLSPA